MRLAVHPADGADDVRAQLSTYEARADELAECYEGAQRINADQDAHTVFECIESALVNPLPKVLITDE